MLQALKHIFLNFFVEYIFKPIEFTYFEKRFTSLSHTWILAIPRVSLSCYTVSTGIPLVVVGISAGIFHEDYGTGSM